MSGKSLESKIQEISRNITCPDCQTICMALLGLSKTIGGFPPVGIEYAKYGDLNGIRTVRRMDRNPPQLYIADNINLKTVGLRIREDMKLFYSNSDGKTHVTIQKEEGYRNWIIGFMCQLIDPEFINNVTEAWNSN
jgi:hypothetical protein